MPLYTAGKVYSVAGVHDGRFTPQGRPWQDYPASLRDLFYRRGRRDADAG
jgi:hypothetical protein